MMEKTKLITVVISLFGLLTSTLSSPIIINDTTGGSSTDNYDRVNTEYRRCGYSPKFELDLGWYFKAASNIDSYVDRVCSNLTEIMRCYTDVSSGYEPSVAALIMTEARETYSDICDADGWVHRYLMTSLTERDNGICVGKMFGVQRCYESLGRLLRINSMTMTVSEGVVRDRLITNTMFGCFRFTVMPRMAEISECESASWLDVFMTIVSGYIIKPALGHRLSQEHIEQLREDVEEHQSRRQTGDDILKRFWQK